VHHCTTRGWTGQTFLVKDRLDITGARWSLTGAEAVLKLRALIANGPLPALARPHRVIINSSLDKAITHYMPTPSCDRFATEHSCEAIRALLR
jgi:hypothetical protein